LGRQAVSTFYYYIGKDHNLLDEEFKERPVEVLKHLRELLGEGGFAILVKPIVAQISETFAIQAKPIDIEHAVELAKKNYLLSEL